MAPRPRFARGRGHLKRLYDALRALDDSDSPVGVAATACEHKRQRCENDHAVCRDCGAVNRAVTGVVDWGPPDPPPDYLTRSELVSAVRSAASAVGGPPRRALDALADALEIPHT